MSHPPSPSRPRPPQPSRRLLWAAALAFALGGTGVGSAALVACSGTTTYTWGCVAPDGDITSAVTGFDSCPCGCCIGMDGSYAPGCNLVEAGPDADAGADGDAEAPLPPGCTGTCVPAKPDFWEDPQLLAIGTPLSMPSCPGVAPAVVYEGYAGLDTSPSSCLTCSCAPPTGSCGLPATVTASTPAACVDAGSGLTPFDPPSDWDGGCTSEGAVPSGVLCGGVPCVRSLTIAPLTVQESGCTASASAGTTVHAVSWSTYAVACIGNASGSCAEDGDFCAALAPVDGFRECISHDGDVACPPYSAYSDQYVFYSGADDTRSCSACACGSPAGSSCSAMISVYDDSACSSLLFTDSITSSASACVDVPAGSALGSKSATSPAYTPGACPPSGGEALGSVVPVMPATFCCLPSP
jgi:hypothetical protein